MGGDLVGRVLLPSFNLISGGQVNLTSGVQVFNINSAAANSQIHLRDTPLNTTLGVPSYVNTVTGAGLSYARISSTSTGATTSTASGLASGTSIGAATGSSPAAALTINNSGTLNPVALGFGGGSVGAINGGIPIINTVGNGENFLGTPGLTQTQVNQGRTVTYVDRLDRRLAALGHRRDLHARREPDRAQRLQPPADADPAARRDHHDQSRQRRADRPDTAAGRRPDLRLRRDRQRPDPSSTPSPAVALQSIPLPASTSPVGGVSLAMDGVEQVVLVGVGPECPGLRRY